MNFTSAAKWRQVVATNWRSGVAAKRRQDVAMGVSPWISKHATRSPEGTKGSPSSRPPSAPSGLPNQSRYANHGLAPMATTFRPFGTPHIRNSYNAGELLVAATCKDYLQVQTGGNREVKRKLAIYNPDVLLAIGYRVRSQRGTQFRRFQSRATKWRQVVATKWRSVVAMGVSPWNTIDTSRSPEGTKGSPAPAPPFAPSGLFNQSYANHGLAPMATTFRPFGTQLTWVGKLHAFLEFNDRAVLNHAGSIQKKVADRLTLEHFDVYSAELRRIEATEPTSDFDRFIEGVKKFKPPRKDASNE